MNTTKPITVRAPHSLRVVDVALRATGTAIDLVKDVSGQYRSLKDQVIRAAVSVPANLAEGHGRQGRDRQYLWSVAFASAKEVDVHIRVLIMAGVVDERQAGKALELFDRVRAMTWRLMHPKR